MIELSHNENDYVTEVHKDENIEVKIDLYNAMDELEDTYKDAIILRYIEDLKLEEISTILDRPVNTIKTHIRRGIKDMKNLLKEGYIND